MLDTPTWLQNGTYSARLDRIFTDVLFSEGVMQVAAGQLLVTQRGAGANDSVDIAAGYACIQGDDTADQGKYLVRNRATVNVAATAAPVANSRIDLVCLRINDPAAGGPAGNNASFVYVTGTPAASPTPPATPTSAIALARVLRTVGDAAVVAANITDVRPQSLTTLSNTFTSAGDLLSYDGVNAIRVPLGTSGFPLVAGATSVGWAQLGTVGIADSAVTGAKLANDSVSTAKIQALAVNNARLATDAVGTANIQALAVDNSKLATDSVSTAKIQALAVDNTKLAANSVDSSKIVDGSIALTDLASAVQNLLVPAGSGMLYVGASAPTGWLLHNQTVAGANTLYPALWAVAPALWKSGTSLVIPDLSDAVFAQTGGSAAALGAMGGAMTVTLLAANMPAHTHTIDHDHPATTSTTQSVNHTHTVSDPLHSHAQFVTANPGSGGTGVRLDYDADGAGSQAYSQGVNTGASNTGITLGNETASHTHSVDLPNFTGSSGSAGSGSAVTIRPRHVGINVILKAH